MVPLSELNEALSSEGYKDYRIAALETALDWAMLAVVEHYDSGESPSVSGCHEELEASRLRIAEGTSELMRLPDPTPAVRTTPCPACDGMQYGQHASDCRHFRPGIDDAKLETL